MTDNGILKEYTNQQTPWDKSFEQIQNQTTYSLESLKQEVWLTEAEKKAIQRLPDYNPRATPEEQKAREDYFIKLKNELIAEIQKQGNESPFSKVLQTIEKNTDKDGSIITDPTKIVKTSWKTDFERFIIYLWNKHALKSNIVACSAIDLKIRSHEPTASSYLLEKRYDYLDTITYRPRKENEEQTWIYKWNSRENIGNNQTKVSTLTSQKESAIPEWQSSKNQENQWYHSPTEKIKSNNGFNIKTTKSHPFERGPKKKTKDWKEKKWTTLCSKTTRLNLEMLGLVNPPRGDALDAMLNPAYFDYWSLKWSVLTSHFKPEWKRVRDQYWKKDIEKVEGCEDESIIQSVEDIGKKSNTDIGELYVSSNSIYGHRAAMFKGEWSNERYVLDPYVGGAWIEPQPLEDYLNKCHNKWREIYRINLFQSST